MIFSSFIFSVLNNFSFIRILGVQTKQAKVSSLSYPQGNCQDGFQILCNSLE